MFNFINQTFNFIKKWIFSIFFRPNYLFCYGSNSIKQLQERLQIQNIKYRPAHLENYSRIFAGTSKKWQNGGVASIYPEFGSKVYGILVEIDNEKLKILDSYEGGYYQEKIIVNTAKENVKAIVYIKKNNDFCEYPSTNYLEAINTMLDDRGITKDRVILIKGIINKKLKTLGKWTKDDGYLYRHQVDDHSK